MRFYMPACVICSFSIIIQHRACSERSLDWIYFGLCEIHSAKRYIADSKKDIIRSGGGGKEKDQDEGWRNGSWSMFDRPARPWVYTHTHAHIGIQKTSGKSFIKQPSWRSVERDQRGKINVNSVWTECTLYQRKRVMPASLRRPWELILYPAMTES